MAEPLLSSFFFVVCLSLKRRKGGVSEEHAGWAAAAQLFHETGKKPNTHATLFQMSFLHKCFHNLITCMSSSVRFALIPTAKHKNCVATEIQVQQLGGLCTHSSAKSRRRKYCLIACARLHSHTIQRHHTHTHKQAPVLL